MPGRPDERVFLGLGGNLGDPEAAMRAALAELERLGGTRIVAVSSLWRTPPWGKADQPDFLNAVCEIRTALDPRQLLAACLSLEAAQRRVRGERWGPRTLDIDILRFGDRRIDEPGLSVPHPRMAERAFVMAPLAEIAPDLSSARPDVSMTRLKTGDWWKQA